MIGEMDLWLENYARLTKKIIPDSDANAPGAGAAGGMGFAFLAYLNAAMVPGIELVIGETGLERHIKDADLVVRQTGPEPVLV